MAKYDVFLDESGLFFETSSAPDERIRAFMDKGRKFPSQIAGVVCPNGSLTGSKAAKLVSQSLGKAGIETTAGPFHATDYKHRSEFSAFLQNLIRTFGANRIQPVRIVNSEAVSFGDRVANYTNILAELLIRICRELDDEEVSLNVYAASVKKSDDENGLKFFEASEYLPRIREHFARAAVANGWAAASSKWELGVFQIVSAKSDERLWLADIVSNASHADFSTISNEAAAATKHTLGKFDWSMSFDATKAYISELMGRGAFGLAMIAIAQKALIAESEQYDDLAGEVVQGLFALPNAIRQPQQQTIIAWLQQLAESRMDPGFTLRACVWVEEKLCAVPDPVESAWLCCLITTWALTACNHLGDTVSARPFSEKLTSIVSKLAGRWEYADDLMQGLVTQSVHMNDCFEHDAAIKNMRLVAGYYESLSGFFHDVYPEVFPETVRSDLCGKALGTLVQSHAFVLHRGEGDLEKARETSDRAIAEFLREEDKQRQYQYRSEIECTDSNWESAREFVGLSLGMSESGHEAIGERIRSLANPFVQGFALAHWTRIGGMAAVKNASAELSEFMKALRKSKLEHTEWMQGQRSDYPTQSILRRLASAQAASGDLAATKQTLARLLNVNEHNTAPACRIICLAGLLEGAGLVARRDERAGKALLIGANKKKPVAAQIIAKLSTDLQEQPRVVAFLDQCSSSLSALLAGEGNFGELLSVASKVGY